MYTRIFFTLISFFLISLRTLYALDVQTLEIEIKDHKFIPDIVKAASGKLIHLVVHNRDDIVEEFESHDLNREKLVPPNSSIKIVLAPLEKGSYKFFGDFHQETAQGVLVVEDAEQKPQDTKEQTNNQDDK